MLNILKGVKLAQDDSTGDVYAVDCYDGPKKLTGSSSSGGGSGQFIVVVYSKNPSGTLLGADKTYNEIRAAIESGMRVVIHKRGILPRLIMMSFISPKIKTSCWDFVTMNPT